MTTDDDPLYSLFDEDFERISPKTGDLIKLIGIAAMLICFAAAIYVGEG